MSNQHNENTADRRPVHGSISPRELRALGLNADNLLDFSASISPIGPPKGIWQAMRSVDLSAYPDPECLELRESISRYLSTTSSLLPIERIFVGNGSTEIFHLLTRVFLAESQSALVLTPTYGEYDGACRLSGTEVLNLQADLFGDFKWDIDKATNIIMDNKPSLIFVCNPNNPTGVYLDQGEVEALADAARDTDCLMVVDEAYLSFVEHPWDSLELLDRSEVMLVRSMTKDYAQTSLRLGYALASEKVVASLRRYQPDWSVNGLAQKAGICALEDSDYLTAARTAVANSKDYLVSELQTLGWEIPPSECNFLLIKVGDAAKWRSTLLTKGIVVRDCTSFGLPEYIRVGIRPLEDCVRLVACMSEVIQAGLAE